MFAERLVRKTRAASAAAALLAAVALPAGAADLYGGYGMPPIMEANPCGQWPSNLTGDWRNLPYENFGCASANNLAVMLEDPDDLFGPRPATPRDAERRDTMFWNYRLGQKSVGSVRDRRGRIGQRRGQLKMSAAFGHPTQPAFDREEDPHAGQRHHPPLPRVSIQAFCETAEVQNALHEASADRRAARTHMTVQAGGVNAAVEFYTNAATPNVVIVETSSRGQTMLSELDRFAEICDPGTRVVVIGHINDIQLYRELMQRGVSEYLVAPNQPLAILRTPLQSLYRARRRSAGPRSSTFIGAKGGVGSSTIAHNVAWSIAQQFEIDVVIVDLDLAFGTAGLDFNQDPPQGIAEAVYAPDRLDETCSTACCPSARDHLSLLAAPVDAGSRLRSRTGDAFGAVLDLVAPVGSRSSSSTCRISGPAGPSATLLGADEVVVAADAGPRLPAQRQEPRRSRSSQARPNDRAAAARPQSGRRRQAAGDRRRGFRQGARHRAAPRSSRSSRSSSARPPTTAR